MVSLQSRSNVSASIFVSPDRVNGQADCSQHGIAAPINPIEGNGGFHSFALPAFSALRTPQMTAPDGSTMATPLPHISLAAR